MVFLNLNQKFQIENSCQKQLMFKNNFKGRIHFTTQFLKYYFEKYLKIQKNFYFINISNVEKNFTNFTIFHWRVKSHLEWKIQISTKLQKNLDIHVLEKLLQEKKT